MKTLLRDLRIILSCLLLILGAIEKSYAVGSPDTRLIGLGANTASAAPFTLGQLFEIDKQTGAAVPLGASFVFEFDQIGANVTANSLGTLFNAYGGMDARLNQMTLAGTVDHSVPISDGTGHPPYVFAIDFDSQDRLHGITLIGLPNADAAPVLSRIDVATGVVSGLTIWRGGELNNMAFDPQDTLYSSSVNLGLVRVDATTGDPTVIGGNLANSFTHSITFDRDGTLLAATDRLLVVDPATGNATPVGTATFGAYAMVGMNVIPVPEPAGATLFGLTALGLSAARRRASHVRGASVMMNSCRQEPDTRSGEHELRRRQPS